MRIAMMMLVATLVLSLDAAPCVADGERVAFLGDSITQFGAWPAGYVNLVRKGLDIAGVRIDCVYAGISGHKSNDMLKRLDRDVLAKRPKWMTLSCGVNDVMHGARGVELEPYKTNITAILDKAAASNVTVIVLTATMIGEDPAKVNNVKLADYNAFLREQAKTRGLRLADLNADMTAASVARHEKTGKWGGLTRDGVHMAFEGNKLMAWGVLRAMGVDDSLKDRIFAAWEKMNQPTVVKVETDRTNGVYGVGEEVTFKVGFYGTNGVDRLEYGVFHATLDDFTEQAKWLDWIDVSKGNPAVIRRKVAEPGFTRLVVKGGGEIKNHTSFSKDLVWGVACAPEKIVQETPCPADFDAFWADAKAKLAREVPLDPQVAKDEARSAKDAAFDWYHVSFATFGESRVYGWLSLPKDREGRKVPCRVIVPGAGFGAYSQNGESRKDCATLFMTVFDFAPDCDLKVGKPLYDAMCARLKENTGVGHYPESGFRMSAEDCFYHSRILGINRAVDWLAAQPYADKTSFTYHGTSQGGGFGLALMALNGNFTRGCVFVPAITGHFMEGGRQQGWPQYRAAKKLEGLSDAERANLDRNAALFDGVNFASRITKPIRFAVGFSDTVCAPHAVYSAYNACPSKDKAIVHGLGMGHDPYGWIYDDLRKWENAAATVSGSR